MNPGAAPQSTPGLDRRTLLKVGWAGAAMVALGGVGLGFMPSELRMPRRRLKLLSVNEFSVLAAMADRFHPGGTGLPSAWDLEVPERVDELLWTLHPADGRELPKALLLVENGLAGALLDGRFSTFTRASADQQDEALHRTRVSPLHTRRMIYTAVKGLTTAVYWGDPRVYAHTGYPGPPNFGQRAAP